MRWRLIRDGSADASHNMGADEAILDAVAAGSSGPTLRLYGWRPSAVSIGRFQALRDSVDLAACRRLGVDVVRRISGGGSVFHGESGEVTYSVVLPEEGLPTHDYISSFEYLLGGVGWALRSLGLDADFAPINDVVVRGRKISGSAQVRRNGAVLQHGTVLMEMDTEVAFRVLRVPAVKTQERSLGSPADRVTTLASEGVKAGADRVRAELIRGFSKSLGVELVEGVLSKDEAAAAGMYAEKRYLDPAWTGSR
ncbi:MAG TPA: biotin/lipoate A/B protein ligase family protein [Conexivisphaerales archaeon]|nr:biotin/lipoate A/B protein ligase family protein [Conexivisphaerales archaeon]